MELLQLVESVSEMVFLYVFYYFQCWWKTLEVVINDINNEVLF